LVFSGYRFYALYDKISREDILAQCLCPVSIQQGAPGVDGQDFADIEAYGVQRWLGELALPLKRILWIKPGGARSHWFGAKLATKGYVTRSGKNYSVLLRPCSARSVAKARRFGRRRVVRATDRLQRQRSTYLA
jgi:hypothetical protein